MKTEEVKSIKIEFEGPEADNFKSAIKKIEQENTRVGFQASSLTGDELKLIKDLNQKINPS